MVWELMPKRRGAQHCGKDWWQEQDTGQRWCQGGVEWRSVGEGLSGNMVQGPRGVHRQANRKESLQSRAGEVSRARTQGPWS